jgi:hypothetical protein
MVITFPPESAAARKAAKTFAKMPSSKVIKHARAHRHITSSASVLHGWDEKGNPVKGLEPRQHGDSAWSEAGQQQRLGPAILKELFSLFVLAAQRRVEFEKCQRSVQATNFSSSSRLNGLCHKYHAIMHLQQSVPGGIRTPNLLIRSQKLYPVELQALVRT